VLIRCAAPTLICANWVSATPVCRVTGTKPLRIDWSPAIEAAAQDERQARSCLLSLSLGSG
jgi:hypothetical protein